MTIPVTIASTPLPYSPPLSSSVGLTSRELQIVSLIAKGYSNQEIADELYLSINSIKTYIRSAYRRIGVERRTQAVLWAITHTPDLAGVDAHDVGATGA